MTGPTVVTRRPRRRTVVLAGAALAAVALTVVGMRTLPDSSTVVAGSARAAPDFAVPDLERPERTIRLSDFAGRPLVINFWASWCVPCRREMPAFARVGDDLAGRVAFLGVNHQDTHDAAAEFAAKSGVHYRSGFDPDGGIARDFGVRGLPSTVFVSAAGRVVGTHTGELSESRLRKEINRLFELDGATGVPDPTPGGVG